MRPLAAALTCLAVVMLPLPALALRDIVIITNNPPENLSQRLVSASPAANEAVKFPPAEIRLTFSQGIRADKSFIRVYDQFNMQQTDGEVSVDGTAMSAALPELPPGRYRVKWRARCQCNEDTDLDGTYRFTIKP